MISPLAKCLRVRLESFVMPLFTGPRREEAAVERLLWLRRSQSTETSEGTGAIEGLKTVSFFWAVFTRICWNCDARLSGAEIGLAMFLSMPFGCITLLRARASRFQIRLALLGGGPRGL